MINLISVQPCPFCNGISLMHYADDEKLGTAYWVECGNEACHVAPRMSTRCNTSQGAASAWNRIIVTDHVNQDTKEFTQTALDSVIKDLAWQLAVPDPKSVSFLYHDIRKMQENIVRRLVDEILKKAAGK